MILLLKPRTHILISNHITFSNTFKKVSRYRFSLLQNRLCCVFGLQCIRTWWRAPKRVLRHERYEYVRAVWGSASCAQEASLFGLPNSSRIYTACWLSASSPVTDGLSICGLFIYIFTVLVYVFRGSSSQQRRECFMTLLAAPMNGWSIDL